MHYLKQKRQLDKNDLESAEKILNEHRLTCLNCVACPELKEKPLLDIQMDLLVSQHILNDAFKILQQTYRAKKKEQEIEAAAKSSSAGSILKAIDTTIASTNKLYQSLTPSTDQKTLHSAKVLVENKDTTTVSTTAMSEFPLLASLPASSSSGAGSSTANSTGQSNVNNTQADKEEVKKQPEIGQKQETSSPKSSFIGLDMTDVRNEKPQPSSWFSFRSISSGFKSFFSLSAWGSWLWSWIKR